MISMNRFDASRTNRHHQPLKVGQKPGGKFSKPQIAGKEPHQGTQFPSETGDAIRGSYGRPSTLVANDPLRQISSKFNSVLRLHPEIAVAGAALVGLTLGFALKRWR